MLETHPQSNRSTWWIIGGVLTLLLFGCIALATVAMVLITGRTTRQDNANLRPAPASQPGRAAVAAVPTRPAPIVVTTPAGGVDYESAVLMNIYAQVNPSVVNISHYGLGGSLGEKPSGTHSDDLLLLGAGSGFVWDTQGHIVTNNHVVEGADLLQVTFSDATVAVAELVGVDSNSDLAVLKIDPEGYGLLPVRRGSLTDIQVGMRVAAIGNPFGLKGTLTSGIISALGRSIPARANYSIPMSIQTDAAINPGNSGGPLLNEQGEVIGVNAQINSETGANSGIGFAIPMTIVERVVPALIAEGKYEHSYLGVSGMTLSPLCADDLQLPKTLRGAYMAKVLSNTPAARADLRSGTEPSNSKFVRVCPENRGGDVITAIEDQPITSFDDVLAYLESNTSPGDKITLRIWRNNAEYMIDVTLGARPKADQP